MRPRGRLAICVMLAALVAPGCHDRGDVRVLALTFDGNQSVAREELMGVIATRESGWLPWSRRAYFDRTEFTTDVRRIERAYADRGFPDARVADVGVEFNSARDGVRLTLRISEGAPTVVDAVRFEGFEVLPEAARKALDGVPVKAGRPRDVRLASATRDMSQRLLHDEGYPFASVTITEAPGSAAHHVVLTVSAAAGPRAYFGAVSVVGNKRVGAAVVERTLTFAPGELYREREVTESQRRLSSLPVFELANIEAHPQASRAIELPATDGARLPVTVTVAEGPHQRATLRAGYGSEERVRVSAAWGHVNFFGGAQTATVETKWSSLERGARFSFGDPSFVAGAALDLTGGAWWSNELAYAAHSVGGRATLVRRFGRRTTTKPSAAAEARLTYRNEFVSYQIKGESLGSESRRSEFIALGLDPETGTGRGTVAGVGLDLERQDVDHSIDPHRGYGASLHIEHVAPWLGGTFRYNEVQSEGRAFVPVGARAVWASRVRFGTLDAAGDASVPFSERYFLGGSTSVRGWGRYEVSPLTTNGQVIGGRTQLELSQEVRLGLSGRFTGVLFADAGNVWSESWHARVAGLRWAIGPGLRVATPVGSLRADFGYQLNPIAGLTVNGVPSTRRWRLHFSFGQAF